MSLHGKFRFLLAIFGVSITANVLVSIWCIHIYMAGATERFETLLYQTRNVEDIRRLLDGLVTELRDRGGREGDYRDAHYRHLHEKIATRIAELPVTSTTAQIRVRQDNLAELADVLGTLCERYVDLLASGSRREAHALLVGSLTVDTINPLQRGLANWARDSDEDLTQTTTRVNRRQSTVTAILCANAALAFVLAAIGVHLVRNWVLKPVDALKHAVEVHASGDLAYRVKEGGRDELGMLAEAVNRSATSLRDIQERLVRQERLAAIGEVASSIAHNIRNPLASVRASVQAALHELPDDNPSRAHQEEVIETVDALSRWLRDLLMVSRPIELDRTTVALREVVDRVVTVMQPYARRRGIHFDLDQRLADCRVHLDVPRVEQALLAIVENAVEASKKNAGVRVDVIPEGAPSWVELSVTDTGSGIDPIVLAQVATPYFSTKPGGMGIGTHLARRIVEAHGGDLSFQSRDDGGTMVVMRLPAAESGAPFGE